MFLMTPGRSRGLAALCCAFLAMGDTALAGTTGFPLEIANCGRTTTYLEPPARAVPIGQGTTEILLSLGLEDHIAGTAIWLSPLPEALAASGKDLPRISDTSPGFEAVLNVRPDFVAAQWINDIATEQARVGTAAQFDDFGVHTYVSPSECAKSDFPTGGGDGARAQAWRVDLLNREIQELSQIFGVPDRGADLVNRNALRIRDAGSEADALQARDVTVLYWFSSPEIAGEAYVAGRFGAPAWISEVVGVRNVITSNEEWPLVGWETIAELDPDVIVLGTMERRTLPGDDITAKRAFLQDDPVASQLSAVRQTRLIEMPAHSMNPTLRAVDGVEVLAKGLKDLGLTR